MFLLIWEKVLRTKGMWLSYNILSSKGGTIDKFLESRDKLNNRLTRNNKGKLLSTIITASMLLSACSGDKQAPTPPTVSPTPVQETPLTSTIKVVADPSLEELKKQNPFAYISKNTLEVNKPDRDLYNRLFTAIENMETTVDVSDFPLSLAEKATTCDSLYGEAGFQFYYMNRIRLSSDGNSVKITYRETGEEVKKNIEIFNSRLSHLIYNIAPEDYTPLQKLFSIYDYIAANADYTDNMQDESTFSPYSIIMNGKGICGGYATLGYYVLNQAGIPTEYISNEPHAWNMVTIDGKPYHTDLTWGAGNYGSPVNFIKHILMDDEQRKLGLDNQGFGEYEIIKGYPRMNPEKPIPATDKTFSVFNNIYGSYALDIENNLIYYSDEEGIKRMTLEGKGQEMVEQLYTSLLAVYNGNLYYVNSQDMHLYKIEPGKEPQLLDESINVDNMYVKNGVLHYKGIDGDAKEKTIDLNPFIKKNFDLNTSNHEKSVTVSREQSFKFEIAFSEKMKIEVLPKENVGLVNGEGIVLPIHMNWSEDGRVLTVRSQTVLDKESAVSLYVSPGILTADGRKSNEAYDVTVNIE
jgi:hypothetical protein